MQRFLPDPWTQKCPPVYRRALFFKSEPVIDDAASHAAGPPARPFCLGSGNVDELLGGITLHEHVAVIQSVEVNLDDIGTGVVDPHGP